MEPRRATVERFSKADVWQTLSPEDQAELKAQVPGLPSSVSFITRCSGESHQKTVKVVEDGRILLVDGSMCLIDDDQIEIPSAKPAGTIVTLLIDEPINSNSAKPAYAKPDGSGW